jgi:hypothetical protein
MMITPQKIKAFTCECFTEGRRLMCAHVAASLVKVRQFLEQRAEERKAPPVTSPISESHRLTVQTALENATPEALQDFVRAYARRDRDFALALKTWFAGTITSSENPYALILASVFPKNTLTKSLREPDFRRMRKTLEDLEVQLIAAEGLQNHRVSFQLASAILEQLLPLLSRLEENRREQLLPFAQTALVQMIGLDTASISPELRSMLWDAVFAMGAKGLLPPELLRESIRFLSASAGNLTQFERIQQLFDEIPFPAKAFPLQLFLAALSHKKSPAASVRVLEDYLEHPKLIRDAILQLYYLQHWETVTVLIEHFLVKRIFSVGQGRELEDILYFIAEKTGDRVRLNRILRERFVQTGQFEFYHKLKISTAEQWPHELELLLNALYQKNDAKNIAAVLAEEGDLVSLAALLEMQDDWAALQRYEDLFLPEDRFFVRTRYLQLLVVYLQDHFGRQASDFVRDRLASLVTKGQYDLVKEIITDLCLQFEERPTLSEELLELLPKPKRTYYNYD